jgi:peptide/nickel transport system substrate-binding protein
MKFSKLLIHITFLTLTAAVFQNCKTDRKGNEITIGIAAEPDQLNIVNWTGQGYTRQVIERNIYSFLGEFNATENKYEPFLAKAAPIVSVIDTGRFKGGSTYTYEILDEAKWDNGQPITGHDFVFTLKAIFNPKVTGAWRAFADFVGDVQVDAANPKKFTVISKTMFIQAQATLDNLPILPAAHYDPKGIMQNFSISDLNDKAKLVALGNDPKIDEFAKDFNTLYGRDKDKISGSGAYALESWEAGQRLVLKKKSNWWGDKLAASRPMLQAYPDRLIYKFSSSTQAQVTELKSGVLDVMATIPATDYAALEKDEQFKKDYNLAMISTPRQSSLLLNTRNPKLSDKKVRQAIANAIDVDELIKKVAPNAAVRMNTLVSPGKEYSRTDLPLIPFNIEKSKQLLSEAGWKDSNGNGTVDKMIGGKLTELSLVFLIPNKQPLPDLAVLVQNTLKQAGIGLEVIAKDMNALKEELKKHNFDIFYYATGSSTGLDNFEQKWHSKQGTNDTGFGNPELDKLIEQINMTLDKTARNELYRKFQGIIYDEQPCIMLMNSKERVAYNKRLDNVKFYAEAPHYYERYFKVK